MKIKIDQINFHNIKGFMQAKFREALKLFGDLPEHIIEQTQWRLTQVKEKSPECYKQDECIHCGCEISSKVFEDRGCNSGCYPPMMDKETWEIFKQIKKQ